MEPSFREFSLFQTISAAYQLSSFVPANLHIAHDRLQLAFVDDWTHFDFGIKPVSDFERLCSRDKLIDEAPENLFVYDHTTGSGAALTRGSKTAPDDPVNCQIEVSILHHHNDVLPTHLQV